MPKRAQRNAPREKRGGITLPKHIWDMLDEYAELQTEAFREMDGIGSYNVSDALEQAAEMLIRDIVDDVGSFPKNAEERRAFVKRLAQSNAKSLTEQLLGTGSKH